MTTPTPDTLRRMQMMRDLPKQPTPVNLSTVKAEHVEGRVVVVIGANIGLGFEAAKHFASMNPSRLVLGCRSEEKGKKAVEEVREATGFQSVELRLLDLVDFATIPPFVDGIVQDIGRVDLLILNAGVNTGRFEITKDGWEFVLQTNNLGPELVALLLLPTILKTEKESTLKPRIVVVSSGAHLWTQLDEDLLNHKTPLQRMSDSDYCTPVIVDRRYSDVKLINIFFARYLQSVLNNAKSSIIVNALNPGFCQSNFAAHMPKDQADVINEYVEEKAYTTEEGSRFLVQAALLYAGNAQAEQDLKGAYFNKGSLEEYNEFIKSDAGRKVEKTIWENTIDVLSEVDQRVKAIVSLDPA